MIREDKHSTTAFDEHCEGVGFFVSFLKYRLFLMNMSLNLSDRFINFTVS